MSRVGFAVEALTGHMRALSVVCEIKEKATVRTDANMLEQVFTNARIVLADEVVTGSLVVRGDRIAEIDSKPSQLSAALDMGGDFLIPGLVELHTDNLERHVMPRPNAYWPVEAAVMNHDREIVAAGITTVFNALCVGEVHSRSMRLQLLDDMANAVESQRAADALKADHFLHWRCELSYGGMLDLLEPLIGHERVRLISVMDHTPGQRQFVDIEHYAEYYQGKFNMSDSELEAFVNERIEDQRRYSAKNRAAVVAMAHERGISLASHDDATEEHVREAIKDRIVIAEFPTTVEAARASHEAGLKVLMGGPNIVRGKSHSGNVSALGLARLNTLDIVSSDYIPASLVYAAFVLDRVSDTISLPEAIAKVSRNPARTVGLDDRGEIAPGLRADLVRVRPTDGAPIVRAVWREGERIA